MHAKDQRDLPPQVSPIQNESGKLRDLAQTLGQLLADGEDSAGGEQAAICLLKYYAVCEHILILIDREVNGKLGPQVNWHSRLLHESSAALPGLRPPILAVASRNLLLKLLAFRNLERNIYGYVPAPYVIQKLSELVVMRQPQLDDEFQRFLAFLQQRPRPAQGLLEASALTPQLAASGSFSQIPSTLPSGS